VTQHHHAVASFDRIVVMFNPHSTGDGPRLAEELHTDLTKRLPEVPLRLCPVPLWVPRTVSRLLTSLLA
jgi:hypothetical protein